MLRTTCRRPRGFTLTELLVVIGIIALLIGILLPVIATVKTKAYAADSQNFVNQLKAAVESYYQDHRAYPGPLANDQIRNAAFVMAQNTAGTGFDAAFDPQKFTMAENLTLGLLGGLKFVPATSAIAYDPAIVGNGASSLNPAAPKRHKAYIEAQNLSWRQNDAGLRTGRYVDGAGFADDSLVPEFVDRYPEPMPILYMRAKQGVRTINTSLSDVNNSIITNSPTGPRIGPYDLSQIIAYTGAYDGSETAPTLVTGNPPSGGRSIGTSKKPPKYYAGSATQVSPANQLYYHGMRTVNVNATVGSPGPNYFYHYDAFYYFRDPSQPFNARAKDSYILISAGADRIYGTDDDITSFGSPGGSGQ